MDNELLTLLSSCLRVICFSVPFTLTAYQMLGVMLEKRRDTGMLLAYLLIKQFLATILMNIILRHYYGSTNEWAAFNTLFAVLVTVLNCLVFWYFFEGEFIKVMLGFTITEIMCACFNVGSVLCANLISGREPMDYTVPLLPADLLCALAGAALAYLAFYSVRRFLQRYRTFEWPHKKLLLVLFMIYLISTQIISIVGLNRAQLLLAVFYLLYLMYAALMVLIICIFWRKYGRSVRRSHEFLDAQQRLSESHYLAVQGQISRMEKSQALIDAQMKKIAEMETTAASKKKVALYLEKLQSEYEEIRAGVYCSDWITDAVLYCQAEHARRLGMRIEYEMQGYSGGSADSMELARMLFLLLEWGMSGEPKEGGMLKLQASAIKNQLLILQESSSQGKAGELRRKLRQYLKQHEGILRFEQTENVMRTKILLKNN